MKITSTSMSRRIDLLHSIVEDLVKSYVNTGELTDLLLDEVLSVINSIREAVHAEFLKTLRGILSRELRKTPQCPTAPGVGSMETTREDA